MTISVRPEVRRAVATIKPPAGMTLQDIALLCACTYFVPQPETPPNYREEMQHGVDNCLQLISYKARVANNAIAEYHADMGLEWDPDCSIWPSAYTPYVELLDSLRMDYGRESRGRNREAREDKAVGGEVM